jgi:hypothetical protein
MKEFFAILGCIAILGSASSFTRIQPSGKQMNRSKTITSTHQAPDFKASNNQKQ